MAGSLKTLNIYQNGSSIYDASTFTSYGIWTDGNKIYKTNNHTPQSGDTELVTLTTPISGLYHNADGEQVSVGLNTVLVITTLAATDIIVYCVNASIKTTLDLSTLSDITDGAHTVKVKAKASGYNDSEFSNEVSYTKAPAGQRITTLSIQDSASFRDEWDIYIKFDGVASSTNYDARFQNSFSEGTDRIYYNGVWSAENADVTVDITATQWSAYVAEQQYSNAVYPCSESPGVFKWVSPSTNGNLYPMGKDNNKFVVFQPAD